MSENHIVFSYKLTRKTQEKLFVEMGTLPTPRHRVTLQSTELSAQARQAIVKLGWAIHMKYKIYEIGVFDSPPSPQEISSRLIKILETTPKITLLFKKKIRNPFATNAITT